MNGTLEHRLLSEGCRQQPWQLDSRGAKAGLPFGENMLDETAAHYWNRTGAFSKEAGTIWAFGEMS